MVNAEFQAFLLAKILDFLDENEKEITRMARNLPVTTARRTNQRLHRLSTAFEALIGYLYLTNKDRLKTIYGYIDPFVRGNSNFAPQALEDIYWQAFFRSALYLFCL